MNRTLAYFSQSTSSTHCSATGSLVNHQEATWAYQRGLIPTADILLPQTLTKQTTASLYESGSAVLMIHPTRAWLWHHCKVTLFLWGNLSSAVQTPLTATPSAIPTSTLGLSCISGRALLEFK